jgi:hypothetical protein
MAFVRFGLSHFIPRINKKNIVNYSVLMSLTGIRKEDIPSSI